MNETETTMNATPDPNRRPSWRARQYGKHRSRNQNVRAYFFASARGRKTLRTLWMIRLRGS